MKSLSEALDTAFKNIYKQNEGNAGVGLFGIKKATEEPIQKMRLSVIAPKIQELKNESLQNFQRSLFNNIVNSLHDQHPVVKNGILSSIMDNLDKEKNQKPIKLMFFIKKAKNLPENEK